MNYRLIYHSSSPASASPYRLLDDQNRELEWANSFLDVQRLRGLSLYSLRAYAYDLLNFARWWVGSPRRTIADITPSTLLEYVRFQLDHTPKPTPQTINHHLTVLRRLYRFHYGGEIPGERSRLGRWYPTRSPLGYGRRRQATTGLRLRQPRHVVIPLSTQEVSIFWRSFRTFRDLGLLALLLFDGLRSHEALALELEDLRPSEAQLRVHGKGNKERLLPLPPETLQILENYLRVERPLTNSPHLFVSLKGPARGRPMTPAGLRSLFRHHRLHSRVPLANPHRFRHTFACDMVRGGVSLPALMQLMGHSHIDTTMVYVQISPQDVWREYTQAVQKRILSSPLSPHGPEMP
jgi:site-specific recombinase XerD